jgi:hypothetical protein
MGSLRLPGARGMNRANVRFGSKLRPRAASALGPFIPGLCCKTPKMAWSDFSAKRPNKRQLPVDVPSSALPKLPVSSSPVAAVPHTIIRSLRPQPGKFVFSDPKRVLQHNPNSGHCKPSEAIQIHRSEEWIALPLALLAMTVAILPTPAPPRAGPAGARLSSRPISTSRSLPA